MLVPKRWAIFGLSISIGSTIGAVILGSLVEHQGLPWVLEFFPGIDKTQMWTWTDEFFDKYGPSLVFAIGASPLMQQPVIILPAIANIPLKRIFPLLLNLSFLFRISSRKFRSQIFANRSFVSTF